MPGAWASHPEGALLAPAAQGAAPGGGQHGWIGTDRHCASWRLPPLFTAAPPPGTAPPAPAASAAMLLSSVAANCAVLHLAAFLPPACHALLARVGAQRHACQPSRRPCVPPAPPPRVACQLEITVGWLREGRRMWGAGMQGSVQGQGGSRRCAHTPSSALRDGRTTCAGGSGGGGTGVWVGSQRAGTNSAVQPSWATRSSFWFNARWLASVAPSAPGRPPTMRAALQPTTHHQPKTTRANAAPPGAHLVDQPVLLRLLGVEVHVAAEVGGHLRGEHNTR